MRSIFNQIWCESVEWEIGFWNQQWSILLEIYWPETSRVSKFLISLEGTDPPDHNSHFSVFPNCAALWRKGCGGKWSGKLIELTLFITVEMWHAFLLDYSKCLSIFNQKNKPTSGEPLPMTHFYVRIFSHISKTSVQTSPASVIVIFGPMVCNYQAFLPSIKWHHLSC